MKPAILLPLDQLIIKPERQRGVFDPVAELELANSITAKGLLHAPAVELDGRTLVYGERRTRAIRNHLVPLNKTFLYNGEVVPAGYIPVIQVNTDDPLELQEIELEENIRREDLTWQERAAAEAKLHALRVAQKQRSITKAEELGAPPEATPKPHTVADTAMELHGRADGDFQNKVRANIIVANNLTNPEVAAAKSAKEALKIIQRNDREARHQQMALAVGKTFSAADHTLLNEDCLKALARPEFAGRFDVILSDPLYGMGADKFGDGGGKLANAIHHYDDSYENWLRIMGEWTKLTWAVTKPEAHLYAFCDFDRYHELKKMLEAAGWTVHRTPLIVYKIGSGRVPWPENGPRRQWETILYAMKGKKKVNYIGSDVIECAADENMDFGAQKPVALFTELLKRSVSPGQEVLDSFAGTGPIIPAGHALQCKVTAIELAEAQFGKMLSRTKEL